MVVGDEPMELDRHCLALPASPIRKRLGGDCPDVSALALFWRLHVSRVSRTGDAMAATAAIDARVTGSVVHGVTTNKVPLGLENGKMASISVSVSPSLQTAPTPVFCSADPAGSRRASDVTEKAATPTAKLAQPRVSVHRWFLSKGEVGLAAVKHISLRHPGAGREGANVNRIGRRDTMWLPDMAMSHVCQRLTRVAYEQTACWSKDVVPCVLPMPCPLHSACWPTRSAGAAGSGVVPFDVAWDGDDGGVGGTLRLLQPLSERDGYKLYSKGQH